MYEHRDMRGGAGDDHDPQVASTKHECETSRETRAPERSLSGRQRRARRLPWRPTTLSLLPAGWRLVGEVDCKLLQYGLQQRHMRELRLFIAVGKQL